MDFQHIIFLFFAGVLGGALNAVAGGGSFVAFPALLFTGVPPIPANATNTIALWVGTTASGGAYRSRLDVPKRIMVPLLVTSFAGGVTGAFLLLKTPAHTFMKVLPWLMLGATLLFVFGKRLSRGRASGVAHDATVAAIVGASVFELGVAVYGGYFGGGVGVGRSGGQQSVFNTSLRGVLACPRPAITHRRPLKDRLSVYFLGLNTKAEGAAWDQPEPSRETQESFIKPAAVWPAITHMYPPQTTLVWPYLAPNSAEEVAGFQVTPSRDDQTSSIAWEELFIPPITHI